MNIKLLLPFALITAGCVKMDDYYHETPKDILISHSWKVENYRLNGTNTMHCIHGNALTFKFEGEVIETDHETACDTNTIFVFSYSFQGDKLLFHNWRNRDYYFDIVSAAEKKVELREHKIHSGQTHLTELVLVQE